MISSSVAPRIEREKVSEADIAKHFAPAGTLGLPPLLDEKRCRYGIPNEAWSGQAMFNKILVWQVPIDESITYGSGIIQKTDAARRRELMEAPRGVIVSAGLVALDELRSHGADIGHTVTFTHLAPFRKYLGTICGREASLVILHAADVFASEELAKNLSNRVNRIVAKADDDGALRHYFIDERGMRWQPVAVDVPGDS